jgi:hypothetical protein
MRASAVVGALFVAAIAGGCIQTLPDGSVVATPTSGSPLAARSPLDSESGPAPGHVASVDRYGRVSAADPDVNIRSSLRRDPCQALLPDGNCASGGGGD